MDEVDEKSGGMAYLEFGPRSSPPEQLPSGPLPGWGRAVRAGITNGIWGWGEGGGNVSKGGVNVSGPGSRFRWFGLKVKPSKRNYINLKPYQLTRKKKSKPTT